MNKIYIKDHANNANKWIYNGYANAWAFCGFQVVRYNNLLEIQEPGQLIMAVDWDIKTEKELKVIKDSKMTFLFVQPTKYELPWSTHPNFVCLLPQKFIDELNSLTNVHKWAFTDFEKVDYYFAWNSVNKYPLAFDNFEYKASEVVPTNDKHKFDVCYIGGRAHNGFDEKYKIMMNMFAAFKDSGLKCGFFIEKNLTSEQERSVIFNSKVCLNIHDANQIKINIDTNERTFKTLGINGVLVANYNGQLSGLFPDVPLGKTPEEVVREVKKLCSLDQSELETIAVKNRRNIFENHTYTTRVKKMLELTNV